MAISPLTDVAKANDKYRASLRSTWIADPADTSLLVNAVPDNVPTYVVVGWKTEFETVFLVTNKSGTTSTDYALTGATRIKGANVNIPENTAVNCLNNEEFFNQYETKINEMVDAINTSIAVLAVMSLDVDNNLVINPTGVIKAKTTVQLTPMLPNTDVSTGDGKAWFRVSKELAGMNLVAVAGCVNTAGTTGTEDIQIRRVRGGSAVDMLSTKLTIDSGEVDSSTAATPAVINTSNDDLAEGDQILIDIDAKHTTAAKGTIVQMTFATP